MQALERQKLLEFAEKDRERIKQEFETKLELNLQLAEEKRRNAQLQVELSNVKLTRMGDASRSKELPSSLLVDVGDNSLDVANAENISTPHAPSRVEGKFETSQSITNSYPLPLVEIGPFSSFAGVPPRQDNTFLTACDFQTIQSPVPLSTQSLTNTQTLTSQSALAGPQILWPTQYNLPHAGAQHLRDSEHSTYLPGVPPPVTEDALVLLRTAAPSDCLLLSAL